MTTKTRNKQYAVKMAVLPGFFQLENAHGDGSVRHFQCVQIAFKDAVEAYLDVTSGPGAVHFCMPMIHNGFDQDRAAIRSDFNKALSGMKSSSPRSNVGGDSERSERRSRAY